MISTNHRTHALAHRSWQLHILLPRVVKRNSKYRIIKYVIYDIKVRKQIKTKQRSSKHNNKQTYSIKGIYKRIQEVERINDNIIVGKTLRSSSQFTIIKW